MSAQFETLRLERYGRILRVWIDHPPMNLLDYAMMRDFDELGLMLEASPDLSVLVVASANPDFFIAHADLRMFSGGADGPPKRERRTASLHEVLGRFADLPQVSIAAIEGRAIGGGAEVAMAFDMRFAARERARLGLFEVALGAMPGAGGTQRLPQLIGVPRALEAALGCDEFDADTAAAYGWVNRSLPASELGSFVDRIAGRIASFPPECVAETKAAVCFSAGDLSLGLAREAEGHGRIAQARAGQPSRTQRFLELGGQTAGCELNNMAELLTKLGEPFRLEEAR